MKHPFDIVKDRLKHRKPAAAYTGSANIGESDLGSQIAAQS